MVEYNFLKGMDTTSSFKVAMIQFNCLNKIDINLIKVKTIVDEMYQKLSENNEEKPLFIVLPEYFNFDDLLDRSLAEKDDCSGPTLKLLSSLAKKYSVFIFGGSIVEIDSKVSPPKYYNTCFVFDTTGKLVNKYRKIHLYDCNKTKFKETSIVSPGEIPCIVTVKEGINIGIGLCFDIMYSHFTEYYASNKCSIVVLPMWFDNNAVEDHLEILFRTRSFENYIYIIGVNSSTIESLGNSICCGPNGNVVSRMGDHEEGFMISTIDLSKIKEKHDDIPITLMKKPLN